MFFFNSLCLLVSVYIPVGHQPYFSVSKVLWFSTEGDMCMCVTSLPIIHQPRPAIPEIKVTAIQQIPHPEMTGLASRSEPSVLACSHGIRQTIIRVSCTSSKQVGRFCKNFVRIVSGSTLQVCVSAFSTYQRMINGLSLGAHKVVRTSLNGIQVFWLDGYGQYTNTSQG